MFQIQRVYSMKDWMDHRLSVLRDDKTLDLYDLLEKKRLQDLQKVVKVVNYAKEEKNMTSSETKAADPQRKKDRKHE